MRFYDRLTRSDGARRLWVLEQRKDNFTKIKETLKYFEKI